MGNGAGVNDLSESQTSFQIPDRNAKAIGIGNHKDTKSTKRN
jgi:hypothetical protein